MIGITALVTSLILLVALIARLYPVGAVIRAESRRFVGQSLKVFFGLLPRRKEVWGTVYDAQTKRPISYALVRLMADKRLLETHIADAQGRYGFLATRDLLVRNNADITISVSADSYRFPSVQKPSIDSLIYGTLYFGGPIALDGQNLLNFDIPLDSVQNSAEIRLATNPATVFKSVLAVLADVSFWLGFVMVPLNYIVAPGPSALGLVFLFLGTVSLRLWGVGEYPFGVVRDAQTNSGVPFALITLHDVSGRRVSFTVSDEKGRYFLVAKAGDYDISVHTPASIEPSRHTKTRISVRRGWITRPLSV